MKKVLFIFLCAFLSVFSVLSLIFLPKKSEKKQTSVECLQIWHIDGFEGGVGSRLNYLKSIASEYSKQSSIVINVVSQTVYSSEEKFKKGIYPGIISYSNGLNLPYDNLLSLENGKNCYAKPWCMGGYLLISRKDQEYDKLIISNQAYTVPLLAVYLSNLQTPIGKIVESTKAVNEFYADKKSALVGTQRDIFRLQNKGIELQITALDGYNDLYQYVSIISNGQNYQNALSFVNYLLYKCNQTPALNKIAMLPPNGYLSSLCQQSLNCYDGVEIKYKTHELISRSQVEKLQKLALNYQNEKESIKNALKRLKLSAD